MIDFHCHVDLYAQPDAIARRIEDSDIGALSVTTTPAAWRGTTALAQGRPRLRTALGLHPELASQRKSDIDLFGQLLRETEFVGEVGLDGSPQLRSTRPDQIAVFTEILELCARAGGKLISIHSRAAAAEVVEILGRHPSAGIPVLHWLSASQTVLREAIKLDCWFSVGPGMLASARGRGLIELMPRDRVVLESDGPFVQVRGLPAGPWSLPGTAVQLAEVWGIPRSEVFDTIRDNEQALIKPR